jgi:general secretion pathway protein G
MLAFMDALQRYRADVHEFPSTDEGLQALRTNVGNRAGWHGPYLPQDIPLDPWGRPYVFRYPTGQRATPEISSWGRDGKPGGDGEDADIFSP